MVEIGDLFVSEDGEKIFIVSSHMNGSKRVALYFLNKSRMMLTVHNNDAEQIRGWLEAVFIDKFIHKKCNEIRLVNG